MSNERVGAGARSLTPAHLDDQQAHHWLLGSGTGPSSPRLCPISATLPIVTVHDAIAVLRLTNRFGNTRLLAGGLTLTRVAMVCISPLSADTPYFTGRPTSPEAR